MEVYQIYQNDDWHEIFIVLSNFFLKKLKIEDVVIENVESMLEYLDFERICYSRAAVGFH